MPDAPVACQSWWRSGRAIKAKSSDHGEQVAHYISIDIRVWFRAEGGGFRASRRGISVRLAEISRVRKGLRKAHEVAVELGFIGKKTIRRKSK